MSHLANVTYCSFEGALMCLMVPCASVTLTFRSGVDVTDVRIADIRIGVLGGHSPLERFNVLRGLLDGCTYGGVK